MSKSNLLSVVLIFGWPLINIGIAAHDQSQLTSLTYPIICGLAIPLLLLAFYWWIIIKHREGRN